MEFSRRSFIKNTLLAVSSAACGPICRASTGDRLVSSVTGEIGMAKEFEPAYLALEKNGELTKREQALWQILKKCSLCPRKCEINRLAGENKICRATNKLRVHSAGAHFGEEKPLVGEHGSGTIFFSNCNLHCCFCQNWEINHRGDGSDISYKKLAETMLGLQKRGCHNINLVTPSHVIPHIVRALRIAISQGLRLPLVYNTGGYDKLDTLKLLDGVIDIYMPDFKFQDPKVSYKYCQEAKDYPEVAATAIAEMHRQVGELAVDNKGIAQRGVILRHLVMPNNLAGTDKFVKWVASKLSKNTYVNLMAQYHPEYKAFDHKEIARRISTKEWKQAVAWAKQAGLKRLDL
jgi:putative pyruvate formate lyase activating enzyme